jgi:hypothetical protein
VFTFAPRPPRLDTRLCKGGSYGGGYGSSQSRNMQKIPAKIVDYTEPISLAQKHGDAGNRTPDLI